MITAQINGRLCKDAEIKHFGEFEMLSFSLPHEEKNSNGTSETFWINVSLPNTKLAEYLKKGKSVIINGEFHFRRDPNDATRVYYEVKYGKLYFTIGDSKALTAETVGQAPVSVQPQPQAQPLPAFDPNEPLPF